MRLAGEGGRATILEPKRLQRKPRRTGECETGRFTDLIPDACTETQGR
jgi:hypothetical protein